MKKAIALFIVALFVLSTTSFAAWWNFGKKKGTEEAAAKTKVETKANMQKGKKLGIVKKTTVKKAVKKTIKVEKKNKMLPK